MKKVVIISVVVFVLIAFMLVGVKLVQNKEEKQGECGCSGIQKCDCTMHGLNYLGPATGTN